jgi:hypothetical protein
MKPFFIIVCCIFQLFSVFLSCWSSSANDDKYVFHNTGDKNNIQIKPDDFFFPSQLNGINKDNEYREGLITVLDECLKEYVECRVNSHLITLKVENYALTVIGLRDLFYDGGKEKNSIQISAAFYLSIFRQLEYETEFMNYLSDETNKRLMLGAFTSDAENIESNILNIFVTCLLKHEFHRSGNIYSSTNDYNNRNGYKNDDPNAIKDISDGTQSRTRIPEGRILQLDKYVEKYMKLRIKGHKIIQRVRQLLDGIRNNENQKFTWLNYYITVLDGIESNGPRFISLEKRRLHARKKQYNYKYKITKIHHENQLQILNTLSSLVHEPNVAVRKELIDIQNNYFFNNKRVMYLIIAGISFSGWLILTIYDCYFNQNQENHNGSKNVNRSNRKIAKRPRSPRKGMKSKFKSRR